jgi:hypothetical protein
MLNFEPINAENILKTADFFKYKTGRTADYTIGALYMWREFYNTCFTIYEDMLLYRVKFYNKTAFTYPVGSGSFDDAINALKEYCSNENIPLWFCTVPEEVVPALVDRYKGTIPGQPNRDWSDYLYLAQDLAEMAGRRFSGQRNHINKFKKLYPDYSYHRITQGNLQRVIEFLISFGKEHGKEEDLAIEELKRAIELMPYFERFNLSGGFIEVEGNIIAMTVGEIVQDTLYCHIEKAVRDYEGAYQMIVKEYASDMMSYGIQYINREDDVGDEGLRKSKLSYHPVQILDKFCVIVP